MEGIDPQTAELYIARLKSMLGDQWCADQLAAYEEFRAQYSPSDLWSHRLPTVSPIVPLLFQHEYVDQRRIQPNPLDYWYGDPIHYLGELASHIFMFEDFWSKLPNSKGVGNIRYKLSEPSQFHGFMFELLVSADSKLNRYRDYNVEPLFFDPRTTKGGADIVLRKGTEEVAIQCKTRSPFSALDMPFDLFHYLLGCFSRLVQDTTYSYKLSLNLNGKLWISHIEELLKLLSSSMKLGLVIPRHSPDPVYYVEFSRLDIPINGLSNSAISKLLDADRGNLFSGLGGLNPNQRNAITFSRIGLCSISSTTCPSLGEYVIKTVAEAAAEAQVTNPLILTLYLYGYRRLESDLEDPADLDSLKERLDGVFRAHPRIKCVNIASSKQEYANLTSGAKQTRTPYLVINNPHFAA